MPTYFLKSWKKTKVFIFLFLFSIFLTTLEESKGKKSSVFIIEIISRLSHINAQKAAVHAALEVRVRCSLVALVEVLEGGKGGEMREIKIRLKNI